MYDKDNPVPDALLCPICVEVPQNEVFQCKNGHCVCQSCCRNLTLCPECRVPYSQGKIRNRVLEELLQSMELDCPKKETGCGRKVKLKDIPNHAENCSRSQIVSNSVANNNGVGSMPPHASIHFCKLLGYPKCEFLLNSNTKYHHLWTHFNNKHKIAMKNGRAVTMNLVNFGNSGDKDSTWTPILLSLQDPEGPSFLICAITLRGVGANESNNNHLSVFNIFLGGSGGGGSAGNQTASQFELELSVRKHGNGEKYKWKVPTLSRADPMLDEILRARPNRQSVDFLKKFYMGTENFLTLEAEIVPVLGDALYHFIGGANSGSEIEAIWSVETNLDTMPVSQIANSNGNSNGNGVVAIPPPPLQTQPQPQPQPQPSTSTSSSSLTKGINVVHRGSPAYFVGHPYPDRATDFLSLSQYIVQDAATPRNTQRRHCDICNQYIEAYPFYHCLQCADYNVCKKCYDEDDVHEEHVFALIANSDQNEDAAGAGTIIPYSFPKKMPNRCKGDNLPDCQHPCHRGANNAPAAEYVCISCDPQTEVSQFCDNCWRRGNLEQQHPFHDTHLMAVTDTDERAEFIEFQFFKRFFPLDL